MVGAKKNNDGLARAAVLREEERMASKVICILRSRHFYDGYLSGSQWVSSLGMKKCMSRACDMGHGG